MHSRTPMRVNICRQSVSPQAEEDNGNSPPKEEPGKVITYSNILLRHNKLNQNINTELAPPDPGLPPSLHSPGGDSQPLTAEVQPFLQLQPPVSQEQFQEATQVRAFRTKELQTKGKESIRLARRRYST